jgi:hypothetical protein
MAAAGRWVRGAPGTYIYLVVLLATAWVLDSAGSKHAHRLVLQRSTNLHQLAVDPVRVIVQSAFWVAAPWNALAWGVLFTLVLAPAEHWLGTLRWAAVLIAGHVGATVITALGLWLGLQVDVVDRSVRHAVDVGASYGFLAVAGVLVYRVRRPWRIPVVAGVVAALLLYYAVDRSYADAGHLIAFAIGLACYRLTPSAAASAPGSPRIASVRARPSRDASST